MWCWYPDLHLLKLWLTQIIIAICICSTTVCMVCMFTSVCACEWSAVNELSVRVTAEWGRPPAEQHSSGSAGGCVGRQRRAEALLPVHTRTHIITTEALERTRVHQIVARTEHVWHHHQTRLFCKTHWEVQQGVNILWWFVCVCFYMGVYTSFGVNGTWITLMFVGGFTVSVDHPRLAERLRTRLNQTRLGQEVITLVTIKVTTEAASLPCPSWSQLGRWTEFSTFVC